MLALIIFSLLLLPPIDYLVGKKTGHSLQPLIKAVIYSTYAQKVFLKLRWAGFAIGICEYYKVPDIVTHCESSLPMPWHPDTDRESEEGVRWTAELSDLTEEGVRYYYKVWFGDLCGRVYSYAPAHRLRVVCDWMNYIFRIDDWIDYYPPKEGRRILDLCLESMQDAIHYKTDEPAAVLTKSWFARMEKENPAFKQRMIGVMKGFYDALIRQAEHRTNNYVETFDEYLALRRITIGAYAGMCLSEYAGNIFLPDEIYHLPIMRELQQACVDHILLTNDLLSFNIEHARGDAHNVIMSLMHHEKMGRQEALDHVGRIANQRVDLFVELCGKVPSFGPELDDLVEKWIITVRDWLAGNMWWHFYSGRYLPGIGLKMAERKRSRWARLYPPLIEPEVKM